MSTVALDVEAVRARFSALQRPTAFFDGPGGTQVPDEVIDAIARYLRETNANLGGPFAASRASDALVTTARATAARFLGASVDEVGFGMNMTTINFALSRALARELRAGDEIVVTRLDHDANISPWLELARDLDLTIRFADIREDTTLDLADLERQLTQRTRVVACPWAANAVGTLVPVDEIARLAHDAGAIAWIDAVHYAPHGPIDVRAVDVDVVVCSAYKFYGPHVGLAYAREELLRRWRPYKVRPAADEPPGQRFETGTLAHELLAGFSAAVDYVESIGHEAISARERELGARFLAGLPDGWRLHGLPTVDGRVSTFAVTLDAHSPAALAERLGERGFAVSHGDYYAIEIMRRLGLDEGAVRIGIVHYTTEDEIDRLLAAMGEL